MWLQAEGNGSMGSCRSQRVRVVVREARDEGEVDTVGLAAEAEKRSPIRSEEVF